MPRIKRLEVPSGRVYTADDLVLIDCMNRYGFIKYSAEGFTLKSKIRSHVYVFGRNDVTDNPQLAWLLGRETAKFIIQNYRKGDMAPCLIGIPTAGNAIAAATSAVAFAEDLVSLGGRFSYRIMRETVKDHGAGANQWINGPYDDQHTYWYTDNVVTDAGTKDEEAPRIIASGYPALEEPWLICVDRQQGGVQRMESHGFKRVHVMYYLLDITYAMGELGHWPKELVADFEREIHEHQFAV